MDKMRLRMIQPQLPLTAPPGPRQIVTNSSEAFFALCARDRSGELVIERVSVGDGNAQWLCDVRYLDE
jgi:hypothetical protein